MKLSSATFQLILSLLIQHAHSANPISITITKISQQSPSTIASFATQPFSLANYQKMATALSTVLAVLQVATLPYIDNQLNSLNGSLQTVANLLSQLNNTIGTVNATLVNNLNSFKNLAQNEIVSLTTTLTNDNNALVLQDDFLYGNITRLNLTALQQIGFVNSTVASLASLVASNSATEKSDIANVNVSISAAVSNINIQISTLNTNEDSNIINNATQLQGYISGNHTLAKSIINEVAINLDSEISGNRSAIENEAINLSIADQNYFLTNLSNLNNTVSSKLNQLDGFILANATNLQNNINAISGLIDADVSSNVTVLQSQLSQESSNLQTLISQVDTDAQAYIAGNFSVLQTEIQANSTQVQGYLSGNISEIQVVLNALSANDSMTVFNSNPNPGSASVLFNTSIIVDGNFAANAYTDDSLLYDVTFQNSFYNAPPIVTVSIVGPAVDGVNSVYASIESLTNFGCVVRVRGDTPVVSDGSFVVQLIAYGS